MDRQLIEAAKLYADRDWSGAMGCLESCASTEANHIDVAYLLGLCHARLGDWEDALLYLEQVVTGSDEILRIYQCRLALAYAYAITGRNRLAEYELGMLVSAGFESPQVFSTLGFAACAQGRLEDAERHYAKSLDMENDNPNALNGLGYVLACAGRDLGQALDCCRRAVERAPDNAAYIDSLGWALFRAGRPDEAREALAHALEIAPGEMEILAHARAIGFTRDARPDSNDGSEVFA